MKNYLVGVLVLTFIVSITASFAAVTTPITQPPSDITESSIQWNWLDNSSNEDLFRVFFGPGSSAPTTITTTISSTTKSSTGTAYSYVPTGLSANTQYSLQLTAYRNAGSDESPKTALQSVYTLALKPTFASSGNGAVDCQQGLGGQFLIGTSFVFQPVNGFGIGADKASGYDYLWTTSDTLPVGNSWVAWNSNDLTLTPDSLGTYYLYLRAYNADGLVNSDYTRSSAFELIPEPTSMLALLAGLGGLGGLIRFRRK